MNREGRLTEMPVSTEPLIPGETPGKYYKPARDLGYEECSPCWGDNEDYPEKSDFPYWFGKFRHRETGEEIRIGLSMFPGGDENTKEQREKL